MYSMGLTKFQEIAKGAKACYKVGQLVLDKKDIISVRNNNFLEYWICLV